MALTDSSETKALNRSPQSPNIYGYIDKVDKSLMGRNRVTYLASHGMRGHGPGSGCRRRPAVVKVRTTEGLYLSDLSRSPWQRSKVAPAEPAALAEKSIGLEDGRWQPAGSRPVAYLEAECRKNSLFSASLQATIECSLKDME